MERACFLTTSPGLVQRWDQNVDNTKGTFYTYPGMTCGSCVAELAIEDEARLCKNSTRERSRFDTFLGMERIGERLLGDGHQWGDVVMMRVYVSDMSHFARINQVYKTFFSINPPPR
jgi:hypothetical protein